MAHQIELYRHHRQEPARLPPFSAFLRSIHPASFPQPLTDQAEPKPLAPSILLPVVGILISKQVRCSEKRSATVRVCPPEIRKICFFDLFRIFDPFHKVPDLQSSEAMLFSRSRRVQ